MFGHGRSSHRVLAERADELGIDDRQLAAQADVDPRRAADALANDIDLEAILSVAEVKRMVRVLDLDFLTVFGIPCAFCPEKDGRLMELRALPRNELIARRRQELGLSYEDLLAKLGIIDWFHKHADSPWAQKRMQLWRAMEDGPDSLDDLSLDQIRLLNKVLLVPTQLLLDVRCSRCGL
jgi:hypothetical protein